MSEELRTTASNC